MKKSHINLLKLAGKFGNKYALDSSSMKDEVERTIQTAIQNASTTKTSGIMPFLKMLKQDQAELIIDITRTGNVITVSAPIVYEVGSVNKRDMAPKYSLLSGQIKKYLESNLELFPTQKYGETITYDNLTVRLLFNGLVNYGLASN